jgi:prepilin-type N-terminal cleavage/methylation domain-containing protein
MLNMRTSSNRPGFSLPEVLVATVLLGIVGGALTKLVVDQMRFFDNMTAVRGARSVARNSINVMLSDLRMVQSVDGVKAASTSSITVRVPYRFGVFCGSTASVSVVSMLPIDSAVLSMAKYAGYAIRTNVTGAYARPTVDPLTQVPVASTNASVCTTTAGIQHVTIQGRVGAELDITPLVATSSTADRGRAVFFFQEITYHFAASTLYPGNLGLYRSVLNGANGDEEIMAPFTTGSGFRFYVAGTDNSITTVPSTLDNIKGVDIVLNSIGARIPAGKKAPPQQKLVTAVFFKNVQ